MTGNLALVNKKHISCAKNIFSDEMITNLQYKVSFYEKRIK